MYDSSIINYLLMWISWIQLSIQSTSHRQLWHIVNMSRYSGLLLLLCFLLASCSGDGEDRLNFKDRGRDVPFFNADSAYHFLSQQVSFGPRNPNSEGHRQTRTYLIDKLSGYAGPRSVYAQHFNHRGYDGDTLRLSNIIAAFNVNSSDRIMLCAHWDTRPRADEDPADPDNPIPGADDGASGVAVLLELARLMSEQLPAIGVDIVLFDGEDYGKTGNLEQYFLGSRYWANNPPVKNYRPRFSILLDMVGGENPRFPKEQYSMQFAPALVNEVWSIAAEKGYGSVFVNEVGAAISDDHVVINRILNIPAIDIIRHSPEDGRAGFAPYWHTHKDNLDIIDKRTLQAVGDVLAELIYNRI